MTKQQQQQNRKGSKKKPYWFIMLQHHIDAFNRDKDMIKIEVKLAFPEFKKVSIYIQMQVIFNCWAQPWFRIESLLVSTQESLVKHNVII